MDAPSPASFRVTTEWGCRSVVHFQVEPAYWQTPQTIRLEFFLLNSPRGHKHRLREGRRGNATGIGVGVTFYSCYWVGQKVHLEHLPGKPNELFGQCSACASWACLSLKSFIQTMWWWKSYWTHLTFWLSGSNNTELIMGNSSWVVTGCPWMGIQSPLNPKCKPGAVSQKENSQLKKRAEDCSRYLAVLYLLMFSWIFWASLDLPDYRW